MVISTKNSNVITIIVGKSAAINPSKIEGNLIIKGSIK
jgi:hypothetical protein